VDTTLVDIDEGVRELESTLAPIPVIGIAGRGYAGRVSFEGEVSGLSAGSLGSYYEFETSARIHLSDRLAVQAGYRVLSLTGKDDPDQIRFRMGGWQFGLELSL
jgi:YfaZ precursor